MKKKKVKLVLASASPRRIALNQLLEKFGISLI